MPTRWIGSENFDLQNYVSAGKTLQQSRTGQKKMHVHRGYCNVREFAAPSNGIRRQNKAKRKNMAKPEMRADFGTVSKDNATARVNSRMGYVADWSESTREPGAGDSITLAWRSVRVAKKASTTRGSHCVPLPSRKICSACSTLKARR